MIASSTANLYINCIISYEILNLLRNSNNIARRHPPSLSKVTIQAMVVYLFSMIVGILYYYIERAAFQAYLKYDWDRYEYFGIANTIWSVIVVVVIPIMFFCYVWITIWYHGYVKISSVNRGMKELVCSFLFIYIYIYIY